MLLSNYFFPNIIYILFPRYYIFSPNWPGNQLPSLNLLHFWAITKSQSLPGITFHLLSFKLDNLCCLTQSLPSLEPFQGKPGPWEQSTLFNCSDVLFFHFTSPYFQSPLRYLLHARGNRNTLWGTQINIKHKTKVSSQALYYWRCY